MSCVYPVYGTTPAPDTPEFWNVHYTIPRHYCTGRAKIQTSDLAAAAHRLKDWATKYPSDARHQELFDWEEDESRAVETKKFLMGLGDVTFYNEQCATDEERAPLQEHIAHKKEVLANERSVVEQMSPPMESLPGLVTAELRMLDMFAGMLDHAARYRRWHVLLATPEAIDANEFGQPGTDNSKLWLTTMDDHSPWRRESTPACNSSSATIVSIPSGMLDDIKHELLRRGTEYASDGCDFQRGLPFDRVVSAIWVDPTLLGDVRARWTKPGKALFWRPGASELVSPVGMTDLRKREIIEADLNNGREALARAPNIRRLAEAELLRLTPFAENTSQLGKRMLVYLVVN